MKTTEKPRDKYTTQDLVDTIKEIGGKEFKPEEAIHAACQILQRQEFHIKEHQNQALKMYTGMALTGLVLVQSHTANSPAHIAERAIECAEAVVTAMSNKADAKAEAKS